MLGVAGGAALGAVLGHLWGLEGSLAATVGLSAVAFAGALIAAIIVYLIATSGGGCPIQTLLLAGVITGLFFSAVITLVVSLVDFAQLGGILHWLMGSLGIVGYRAVGVIAVGTAAGTAMIYAQARRAEPCSRSARSRLSSSGSRPSASSASSSSGASLLTGVIVAQTGPIGFVGLIVPHGARLVDRRGQPAPSCRWLPAPARPSSCSRTRWRASSMQPAELPGRGGDGVLRRAVLRLPPADPPPPAKPVSREPPPASAESVRPPCLPRDVAFGYGGAFRLDRRVASRWPTARSWVWSGPTARGRRRSSGSCSKVHAPDRGEIRFRAGRSAPWAVSTSPATWRSFPQEEQLAFSMSVEELVLMGRFPRGRGGSSRAPTDLARPARRWRWPASSSWATIRSTRWRAASASARCSPARSPRSRRCSCWTSRRAISISSISGISSGFSGD